MARSIDPLRRRASWPRVLLFVSVALGTALLFRHGLMMAAVNPLPPLEIGKPGQWFIDWRLASIRYDRQLCARIVGGPGIQATPVPDAEGKNGCGWTNAVRLASVSGVRSGFDRITCETAIALALWMEHEVQPLAKQTFGVPVASLESLGSYACRNIVGTNGWSAVRSQHAYANAVDIAGFVLKGGRTISVRRHWKGEGREARFLREVHARACGYFRVVLGPDFNAAHHNHFHLDRGPFSRCV